MLTLDADLTGLDEVLRALDAMQDATSDQRDVLRAYTDAAIRSYQAHTPVGRGPQPGTTKASYQITSASAGPTSASSRIENRVAWLRYILEGRGPVVATKAKALRFVIDGQVFFRKAVGPAEANPFNEPAEAEIEDMSGRYVEQLAALVEARFG